VPGYLQVLPGCAKCRSRSLGVSGSSSRTSLGSIDHSQSQSKRWGEAPQGGRRATSRAHEPGTYRKFAIAFEIEKVGRPPPPGPTMWQNPGPPTIDKPLST